MVVISTGSILSLHRNVLLHGTNVGVDGSTVGPSCDAV
jgi:hypothetical protein